MREITVRDSGTGLMLVAGTWKHPLSYEEGRELKETLKGLLSQPIEYGTFEVVLPEDGGGEKILIGRENAYSVYVQLKRMFNTLN